MSISAKPETNNSHMHRNENDKRSKLESLNEKAGRFFLATLTHLMQLIGKDLFSEYLM